jgi:hypothetical protein
MEDDHGPLLRLEPEEAAFDLVAVGDRRFDASDRRRMDLGQLDIDTMAPEPARLIDTGAHDQPV